MAQREHEDTGPAEERVPNPIDFTQRHMGLPLILRPPGTSTRECTVGRLRGSNMKSPEIISSF